jgi:acyl carrier protein
MSDSITDRVTGVIAEQLYLPPGSVSAESTFEDLGIDSLTGLNLIYQMEKEFGVEVPNEKVLVIRCIKDIVACLEPMVGSANAAAGDAARSSL